MKKEPCWDLSINTEAGDGPKSTPRKRGPKATPKKSAKAEVSGGSGDEESFTPSKKSNINKVHSGRIAKHTPSRSKSVKSYVEEEDDEDDMAVKGEVDDMTFEDSNGNGYEHSGNDNG